MGRRKNSDVVIDNAADNKGLTEKNTALVQTTSAAAQVADMLGYDLPYERERVIHLFNFHANNAAESMLQMGRNLILLKENEPYGEFLEIVSDRLGLNVRTAQKMMQAAIKFLGLSPKAHASLGTHLSKSKLFVLMHEEDADLEALAEGGTLAGATLEDMQRMTRTELETSLRELREDNAAKDRLITNKDQAIAKLQVKQSKIQKHSPDEEGKSLLRELNDWMHNAKGIISGELREGLSKLQEHAIAHGTDYSEVASGLLNQLTRSINELHTTLDIKRVADGDPTPEFAK